MEKNTRIIRLDKDTVGLILDSAKLLVIENDRVVTMGKVPDDIYPIHPVDLTHLPWETKLIIHSVMVSYDLMFESPFFDEMTSNTR